MYDTIIVGGGITGLYCAIHLQNVLVLEESNEWGGKIHKHYHPHFYGAGRFHKNHRLLWNLIKKFKLTARIRSKPMVSVEDYLWSAEYIWKSLQTDDSVKPLYDRCLPVLGESDAIHFVYGEGFHEMYCRNAYDFPSLDGQEYYAVEGLKELCHRMIKSIKGTCVLNHSVKTITPVDDRIKVDGYEGKRVIVTIPSPLFKYFPILSPYDWVSTPSLLRIYAKYSISWFETLASYRLLPMHDGIVLILYLRGDILKFTYKGTLKLEPELRKVLHQELTAEFPKISIPEPLWIKPYLWVNRDLVSSPPIKQVFVCGDDFSTRPYWIEGALESAETILQEMRTNEIKMN